MRKISYKDYLDKVFGCWLGKCISGTIGAPFEGRKELFNFTYDSRSIENMLPNDDLDLQVLWLEVMEKKGIYFKTEDLADAFLNQCPYSPGEYQVFKKNYARGIRPPYSGTFNNSYYYDGMGCPIRSEIWGCISPGNPKLAADYSWKDGIMDHGNESVYAEAFLAAMEATAFFESDLYKLIDIGLSQVPADSRFYNLVIDVITWTQTGKDWRYIRELIINKYGHPDCTNMFQNMGFIILALLYCKGDFIETSMLALNCGYDTDCSCATVGALLGIIYGAQCLMNKYDFKDTGYVLGVDVKRRSNLIFDLAEDTCRVGVTIAKELNHDVEMVDCPEIDFVSAVKYDKDIEMTVEYLDTPSVGIGETAKVNIRFKNNKPCSMEGIIEIKAPEEWIVSENGSRISIPPNGVISITVFVKVPISVKKLNDRNILTVKLREKDTVAGEYNFGIAGAAAWKMYGPFWDNIIQLPSMDYWDSYGKYIKGIDQNNTWDMMRDYHLNASVDLTKEYVTEPALERNDNLDWCPPALEGKLVNTHTDRFNFDDLVGIQGPCVIYLERLLYSPEERNVGIQVGYTDACKMWINDELVCVNREPNWCTNENRHFIDIKFKKGVNRIILKLVRRGASAAYSLIFSDGASMAAQFVDFSSMNPVK